ncbi:RING-box protein 1-like [Drosophila albomicans]|uniref:RING-box protein 1-like n=1 Tax=Drosophila albomicans TaxID=7291 RepID=A0A6P8WN83_DROAB|nr:RING-box protein 1-like [Drosophila albomicans]
MADKKADSKDEQSEKKSGDTLWTGVLLDIQKDICAICRNHLKQLCIDCEAEQGSHVKKLEEMCPEVTGKCNHVFHWHCISPWLKTKTACPLDYRTWEFKYTGKENQKF